MTPGTLDVLLSAATVSSPWVDGLYQQQQPATTGVKHHNRRATWISRCLLERTSAAMSLTHVSLDFSNANVLGR
jgi:hypothetical protein